MRGSDVKITEVVDLSDAQKVLLDKYLWLRPCVVVDEDGECSDGWNVVFKVQNQEFIVSRIAFDRFDEASLYAEMFVKALWNVERT